MAEVMRILWKTYNNIIEHHADPRTNSFFLINSPLPLTALLVIYFKFVLNWGPKFMENREPFVTKKILILYNFTQIIMCAFLLAMSIIYVYGFVGYNIICEPIDRSDNPKSILIAKGVYLYFLLKLFDLLDTVFFVLRKKSKQISFLHVYHHSGVCFVAWAAVKFFPGGNSLFMITINLFVHMVMYFYYLTALLNDKNQALWWKKHLTQLQIFQFLLLAIHMLILLINPNCEYPKFVGYSLLPQNLFIALLFIDFYYKNYILRNN